ncbi:hypothetical protein LJR290_001350 [Variovorax sp. LjRoot290]
MQAKLTFDPIKSFVPVAGLFKSPLLIVAANDFPARTPRELVARTFASSRRSACRACSTYRCREDRRRCGAGVGLLRRLGTFAHPGVGRSIRKSRRHDFLPPKTAICLPCRLQSRPEQWLTSADPSTWASSRTLTTASWWIRSRTTRSSFSTPAASFSAGTPGRKSSRATRPKR